jgi:hypothetical protein
MNPTQPKPTEGREANGRIAPGNPGGPGNPFARKVAALRNAIVEAITEEDIKEIVAVLKQKAKEGSTAAIKLIFQYAIGKPCAENDPDRVDLDGWQLLQEAAQLGVVATRRNDTPPARGTSALPASVPPGLVDRLALAGLGAEHVSILGGRPPLPNGEIGAQEAREKKPR